MFFHVWNFLPCRSLSQWTLTRRRRSTKERSWSWRERCASYSIAGLMSGSNRSYFSFLHFHRAELMRSKFQVLDQYVALITGKIIQTLIKQKCSNSKHEPKHWGSVTSLCKHNPWSFILSITHQVVLFISQMSDYKSAELAVKCDFLFSVRSNAILFSWGWPFPASD